MRFLSLMRCLPVFIAATGEGGEITGFTFTPVEGQPAGRRTANLKASLPGNADYQVEDSPDLITWHRVSPVLRPAGGTLEWSHIHYAPIRNYADVLLSGFGDWSARRYYRVRELPAADAEPAGTGVTPSGRLTAGTGDTLYFLTTLSNWRIEIAKTQLKVIAPNGQVYEIWGEGGHENLRGKHLKDMQGLRRSILLPGDTMITVTLATEASTLPAGTIFRVSVYDAEQSHRINVHTQTVEMSASLRRAGEAAEPDGETARMWDTGDGVYLENIYHQPAPGEGPLTQEAIPVARSFFLTNPNGVNDFYDDPRLGHT